MMAWREVGVDVVVFHEILPIPFTIATIVGEGEIGRCAGTDWTESQANPSLHIKLVAGVVQSLDSHVGIAQHDRRTVRVKPNCGGWNLDHIERESSCLEEMAICVEQVVSEVVGPTCTWRYVSEMPSGIIVES